MSDSKQTFQVVNVKGLFDISHLHRQGSPYIDAIQALTISSGTLVNEDLKKKFAVAQFN